MIPNANLIDVSSLFSNPVFRELKWPTGGRIVRRKHGTSRHYVPGIWDVNYTAWTSFAIE